MSEKAKQHSLQAIDWSELLAIGAAGGDSEKAKRVLDWLDDIRRRQSEAEAATASDYGDCSDEQLKRRKHEETIVA